MSLVCLGSTCSVPATLGLPPLTGVGAFPSTLLRLQVALQGVGPALRALPNPKPLRFRFSDTLQRQTRLGRRFVPSPARAAQAARSLTSTLSPDAASLLPSAVPASVFSPIGQVRLVSLLGS